MGSLGRRSWRRVATAMVAASLGPSLFLGGGAAASEALPRGAFAGPAREVTVGPSAGAGSLHFSSRNWDGYITSASNESTDFNGVAATWVQPTVTCQTAQAWTVFWVGLDGWWDGTVEQGGSSAFCPTQGGKAQYTLWWEMYPTNSIQSVLAINPGDKITASVVYSTATAVYTITVKDATTGQHFVQKQKCGSGLTCQRSSADIITEDVGRFGASTYFPLANYGRMSYVNSTVGDVAGHVGSISNTNWLNAAVTEASGGVTYATVTPLSATGRNFTTIWHHQ